MKQACSRRSFLQLALLAPSSCVLSSLGDGSEKTGQWGYVTRGGWVCRGNTCTDNPDEYNRALAEISAAGAPDLPAVLGSASHSNFPWDAGVADGKCPICRRSPLVNLRNEYLPLGEDGNGPPMNKTWGRCPDPTCPGSAQDQYLTGSKRPAAPRVMTVEGGATVLALPAPTGGLTGWLLPRSWLLRLPTGVRPPIMIRIPEAAPVF